MARTTEFKMYSFTFDSFITGHHEYKEIWTPHIGDVIQCEREPTNAHDRNAVRLIKGNMTVGHVPCRIAPYCAYILLNGGTVEGTVMGHRQNKRNNGLEIPCMYSAKGTKYSTEKAEKCIFDYLARKENAQ